MNMNWTPICELDDILPNTGVGALLQGRQIAIFRLEDDSVYAIDNFDPHSQANVLSRGIVGCIDNKPVVASPIYKQHFRLRDGLCLENPDRSVMAHNAQLNKGVIKVCLNMPVQQAA